LTLAAARSRQLRAQGRDLRIERVDFGEGAAADLLLGGERRRRLFGAAGHLLQPLVAGRDLLPRRRQLLPFAGKLALEPGDLRREPPARRRGVLQLRRKERRILPQLFVGARFEGQHLPQRIDLMLQFVQRRVAPGQRRRQVELAGGEDQQDKDDHHQQLRQGIDEARPDVDAARAAGIARGDRHRETGAGSAPAFFGEGGDGAGEEADLGAQFLRGLGPALGQIFGQAR
jgi:hypothetical protein